MGSRAGRIFVGWLRTEVVVAFSGGTHGMSDFDPGASGVVPDDAVVNAIVAELTGGSQAGVVDTNADPYATP
jgi:hypothetical protein